MHIWILLVVVFLPAAGWAASVGVLTPPDATFVESDRLSLVAVPPQGMSGMLMITVGEQVYTRVVPDHSVGQPVCFKIRLDNGLNRITLSFSKGSDMVARTSLQVYLRSNVLKPYQHPPAGFQRYYFHPSGKEDSCSACHRMEATLQDMHPERIEDSPCYPCHKNNAGTVYKHAPAAAGNCFSCHEVSRGKRKYATQKPDRATCFVCHSAQHKIWKGKRVHHGPTAVGNCTICHNPHGSDWPSFVRMHPTDLCLNCHHDKKSGIHVIAGFFAKGHPVKAASDPLKPDRPFSCAGCHNPHAGDTQNLLNGNRDNQTSYCQSCHKL